MGPTSQPRRAPRARHAARLSSARRALPLTALAALLVALAGCRDQAVPSGPGSDGPLFNHVAGHLVVNSAGDADNDGCGTTAGDTECTLREAVNDPASSAITFSVSGPITLVPANGPLTIAKNLTITGPAGGLTVQRDPAADPAAELRIFEINSGTVQLTNLTISGARMFSIPGAGININDGTLTLTNSTVTGNSARTGAGIRNNGTLTLTNSTVSGNTATGSFASGGGIYNVSTSGPVTLRNSTVSNNSAVEDGGGILNINGTLTLENSTVSGNTAATGGGIYNSVGTITLRHSTVSGNSAISDRGGGIHNVAGTLTVSHSTVSGNTASEDGGGIISGGSAASLTLTNSTVSGNTAGDDGGGLVTDFGARLTLTNTTVTRNTAGENGGGITNNSAALALDNALVAGNTAPSGPDIFTVGLSEARFSLIGKGDASGLEGQHGVNGNQVGTSSAPIDPKLGLLANNGGPTKTHALQSGSPALNAGDPAFNDATLPYDQRGAGFPRVVGGRIDIGSFELQQQQLYSFTGFFSPVDNPGPGPEYVVNRAKAGSSIPVKFSLGGDQGLDIFEPGYPKFVSEPCDANDELDPIEVTVSGPSGLTYDPLSERYTYIWKTQKAWATRCGRLELGLDDGSEHHALFKFVR